jgi:hypothetical protein
MSIWDQKKTPLLLDSDGRSMKQKPLFTSGEGKKRIFGKLTWNKEGLKYFHIAEINWQEVYRSKEQMSALVNGLERWEPDDDRKIKDLLRTRWRLTVGKDNDTKKDEEGMEDWEKDDGYHSLDNLEIDYELDDENHQNATGKTKKKEGNHSSSKEEEEDENEEEDKEDDGGDETNSVIDATSPVEVRKSQREQTKMGNFKN